MQTSLEPRGEEATRPRHQVISWNGASVYSFDFRNATTAIIRGYMRDAPDILGATPGKKLVLTSVAHAEWDAYLTLELLHNVIRLAKHTGRFALIGVDEMSLQYHHEVCRLMALPFTRFMQEREALEWLTRPRNARH